MQETMEKTPGVYVRSNDHAANELDMLWSGARHFKEERSPVLFFLAGLVIGIVASTAVFFFLFYKPIIQAGENALTTPISSEKDLSAKQPAKLSPVKFSKVDTPAQHTRHEGRSAAIIAKPTPQPVAINASGGTQAQTHVVKNGDTLEKIAHQYYGSGTPEYVEKIARANKLTNPNDLRLDQSLVIPPKNY